MSGLHRRDPDRRPHGEGQALVLRGSQSDRRHRCGGGWFGLRCGRDAHAPLPGCGSRPLLLDALYAPRSDLLQFAAGGGWEGVSGESDPVGKQGLAAAPRHPQSSAHGLQQPLRRQRGSVCRHRPAALGILRQGRSVPGARGRRRAARPSARWAGHFEQRPPRAASGCHPRVFQGRDPQQLAESPRAVRPRPCVPGRAAPRLRCRVWKKCAVADVHPETGREFAGRLGRACVPDRRRSACSRDLLLGRGRRQAVVAAVGQTAGGGPQGLRGIRPRGRHGRRALPYSHGIETAREGQGVPGRTPGAEHFPIHMGLKQKQSLRCLSSNYWRRALPYSHGIETLFNGSHLGYFPGAEHFPIHMGLKQYQQL